jgi:hypothetical protein
MMMTFISYPHFRRFHLKIHHVSGGGRFVPACGIIVTATGGGIIVAVTGGGNVRECSTAAKNSCSRRKVTGAGIGAQSQSKACAQSYTFISGFSPPDVMIIRETNYYMAKGRAFRRVVTLFDTIEDLVIENDRRCGLDGEDDNVTLE